MIIDTQEVISVLKALTGRGQFQCILINSDGSMTAIFSSGLLQFDKDGKLKTTKQD